MISTLAGRGVCVALLCASLAARSALAEEAEAEEPARSSLVPLPIFLYSPETKSGGGVALSYFRRPEDSAPEDKPSSYSAIAIFTQRKQLAVGLSAEWYSRDEAVQVQGAVQYAKFPETFHGVGNATLEDVSEDFTPRTVSASASVRRELAPDLRAGPTLSFVNQDILEIEEDGLLDTDAVVGSDGGRLVVAGVVATLDRRDRIVYPRAGHFSELSVGVSDGALGSDFEYASFSLDGRMYRSLSSSQVVAVRCLLSSMTGVPPFQTLAGLGGDTVMRGYYAGRFRDRQRYVVQGEYRLGYYRRVGLAVFAAAGDVAHRMSDLRLDEVKFSGGFGVRFLVSKSEGVTIRADLGFGEGGSGGTYLAILEAF